MGAYCIGTPITRAQVANFYILDAKAWMSNFVAPNHTHIPPNFLHNDQKYAYTLKNGVTHARKCPSDGRRSSLLRTGRFFFVSSCVFNISDHDTSTYVQEHFSRFCGWVAPDERCSQAVLKFLRQQTSVGRQAHRWPVGMRMRPVRHRSGRRGDRRSGLGREGRMRRGWGGIGDVEMVSFYVFP